MSEANLGEKGEGLRPIRKQPASEPLTRRSKLTAFAKSDGPLPMGEE